MLLERPLRRQSTASFGSIGSRPGTRRAAAQSLPGLACTSMTAFSGVRLSSRRQRTTGERRGPVIRSENGDRQERVELGHRSTTLVEPRSGHPLLTLLIGQQRLEIRKRRMGRDTAILANVGAPASRFQLPLMFVVVAVQAEQFPVAAVGRVVVMIVIAVVDRELTQVGVSEFAAAAATDPRIDLEGLLPVALLALFGVATSLG